ncbi:MAG: XdhC family protein [Oscillospiraceae bacterium]|nr:XdhC family protein [Oscillospiraceae bacterium]
MRQMLKIMRECLLGGEDLALVTVTAASGAVPRGAGARMLMSRKGRLYGTIGGGAVEYRAQQIAREVIERKCSHGQSFALNREDKQNLGMICGGNCEVFFHFIAAEDANTLVVTEEAERYFAQGRDVWLISDLAGGGTLSLADRSDAQLAPYMKRKPCRLREEGRDLFLEQICTSSTVYVFGGGYVAQELVPVLSHVGFRCVVMEDREEFARRELFPTAERIILGDFNRVSDYCTIGREDYVCIMTRGHAYDTVLQAQVLRCRPCYCGVIGSRSKAAGVREALRQDYGLTDEELNLVTTPIGLPIRAETPAEIAISIAAQMILHRTEQSEKF